MTEKPNAHSKPVVLLFLKAPRAGKVKTRLARGIGAEAACGVYRRLAEAQLNRIPECFATEIHYAPADAPAEMRAWLGEARNFFPQSSGDLGERLAGGVKAAFRRGASEIICVGGDCPGLAGGLLESALSRLRSGADLVLGPCEDGGYYLIGMRSPQPEIFRDIPWSAPETLAATRSKAEALGFEVALLETLYDVDSTAELERARRDGLL